MNYLTFPTSGSTGQPRLVQISQAAWDWAAQVTQDYLGGPGRWIAALPTDRVGGAQVITRARLAAQAGVPEALIYCGDLPASDNLGAIVHADRPDDVGTSDNAGFGSETGSAAGKGPDIRFSVPNLLAALRTAFGLPPAPVFLSLVPAQLFAILASPEPLGGQVIELLARCSAVLVGGAALDPGLHDAARAAGIPVVTTYGMTETSCGCVYGGVPLPGVAVRIADPDADGIGVIELSGPMLADGYQPSHRPQSGEVANGKLDTSRTLDVAHQNHHGNHNSRFFEENGQRWFRTSDLGRLGLDGRLEVLGRADDVIITGGVNVHPQPVAAAIQRAWAELTGLPAQVAVIGLPHPKWGQQVTAVITGGCPPTPSFCAEQSGDAESTAHIAETLRRVRAQLGPVATPKQAFWMNQLPTLSSGKLDRKALADQIQSLNQIKEQSHGNAS